MDEPPQGLPGHSVDVDQAHAWLTEQYAAGWQPMPALPSEVLIGQLGRFTVATVLGPEPQDAIAPLSGTGQRISGARADEAAAEAFRWLLARGGRTLVVEDDVGVRSHPGLTDVAYVGDRLLRWCTLTASCEEAVALLDDGATGYPRNAYVCDADAETLGLQVGRTLDDGAVLRVASHAQTVISGVWDDECYVLCWSPTGSDATPP